MEQQEVKEVNGDISHKNGDLLLSAAQHPKQTPPVKPGQCKEKTNFVYMKSIKCASQTLVSIFRRFGYYRNLSYVLPVGRRIYIGWPYQIDPGYYRPKKTKEFNILCDHAVYNKTTLKNLMPADTVYITSIRSPYEQVKSTFAYYGFTQSLGLENFQDPFTEFMRNAKEYDEIYQYTKKRKFRYCIPDGFSMSSNLMSFVLGFPTGRFGLTEDKTKDDAAILKWLQDLDNDFSLVIIVEYFDESLILLKRLMCWSWKDIIYYSSNVLTYSWKDNVDPENVRIHKERNHVDYMLYDHFNQTFWIKVAQQKEDFWDEVKEYKRIFQEVHNFCDTAPEDHIFTLHESRWSSSFTFTKSECFDMVHNSEMFLKIKERYDNLTANVVQPPMEINAC